MGPTTGETPGDVVPHDVLIESILLVAQEPVSLDRLGAVLGLDRQAIERALQGLALALRSRGARLQWSSNGESGQSVALVTAPEAAVAVERFLRLEEPGRLSPAALETLAIIAYQQPVTRAQVEAVRGVNSDRAISTLQARGLIAEVGRLETVGRPALFSTTAEFLQAFGLERIEALPPLSAIS
ncbi:MAG: SMC-Scp complex subunit ScpB [Chloroflexi bacterium]|nr:SMC-Scp complex subunit ScpB [Chloroflexota bacterium]